MAITIERAHYLFKQAVDMVDSLNNKDFNPAEIDEFLNRGQFVWFDNNYKYFEVTQGLADKLAPLVVRYPVQPELAPNNTYTVGTGNVYEFYMSSLNSTYAHAIRANANVTGDSCSKSPIEVTLVEHDDLNKIERDPYRKSSGRWERCVGTMGESADSDRSIFLYDHGDFTVTGLQLDYLRYPSRVSLGGYTDVDGSTTTATEFEINDDTYVYQIINLAVLEAQRALERPDGFKLAAQRVTSNT